MVSRILILTCVLVVGLFTACSSAGDTTAPVSSGGSQPPASSFQSTQPVTVTAGEIDDNMNWDQYAQYRNQYLQRNSHVVWDVNVANRQTMTVIDQDGFPVLGARVMVFNDQSLITQSHTYATGKTLFFPDAWSSPQSEQTAYQVIVQKDQQAFEFTFDPQESTSWVVQLPITSAETQAAKLDILFLLDSTGSMADEISQLQNNILAISEQINQSQVAADVRFGLVDYKDRGDDFVTRVYDFTPSLEAFQTNLNGVRASGGGDTPESLNEALHEAVQGVTWRGDDTIKLIFLVADAPPHLDYPNDYDYSQEMIAAAWQGIKIHPIASSNLPSDGEFIFRQLAQYTMGKFIFLTYERGTSGSPGTDRTDLHVGEPFDGQQGDYTVEHLDDLVLRLIIDEIASLNQPIVDQDSLAPQMVAVSAEPEHAIPTSFALSRPIPVKPSPVGNTVFGDLQLSISWPMFLALLAIMLLIGYSLNAHRQVEKLKRKNEDLLAE